MIDSWNYLEFTAGASVIPLGSRWHQELLERNEIAGDSRPKDRRLRACSEKRGHRNPTIRKWSPATAIAGQQTTAQDNRQLLLAFGLRLRSLAAGTQVGRWSRSVAINKGYETAGFGLETAGGVDAGGILRKIDFYYTRNDFGTGKIDLVWNVSTFYNKKNLGIPKTILL